METSATQEPETPIFVLGKKNDYVYVAPTVQDATEHTNQYLPPEATDDSHAEPRSTRYLSLDELDFFDGIGRPLEPIVAAGQLDDLEVRDCRQEVRDRIRKAFASTQDQVLKEKMTNPAFEAPWMDLPDKPIDFRALGRRLIEVLHASRPMSFPYWIFHH